MKLAITGKGGVGKTTLAAALAKIYSENGYSVIAVDADPDANLASALGIPPEVAETITPISHLKDLIAERTGGEPGTMGGMFSLNPKVDDIPDMYVLRVGEIRLMVMGTVETGGMGCVCPESAFVRRLLQHLVIERDEVVIMDMEAGIEHLGRATAKSVDALLVVLEPGRRSAQTAKTIKKLAGEIGLEHVFAVMNRFTSEDQEKKIAATLPDLPILGKIGDYQAVRDADLNGLPAWESSPDYMSDVSAIWEKLKSMEEHIR